MAETRIKKLVGEILENPKKVGFPDLCRLLEAFGYECRQPRGGSSHYTFRKEGCKPITVPKEKPLNRIYVKQVIALLGLEDWYEKNS